MSNLDSQRRPEIFRFLHALFGTLLVYLAVYALGRSFDCTNLTVAFDVITCTMFATFVPLMWYVMFLTNEDIREDLKGRAILYAYYGVQLLTIIVALGMFYFWIEAMLALEDFGVSAIIGWTIAFILYTLLTSGVAVVFVGLKIFPSFERFGL